MEYNDKYLSWLKDESIDIETKKELEEIKEKENEIKERFYKDLEFGTAGLRGIVGARYKQNEQIYCWESNSRISKLYFKNK